MTANGRIIGTLSKEVVILHIIGEDHYLSDIEIAPELIVLEAFLHPFGLSLNAGIVILFLDLDECKWKTIDEQRNIGAEVIRGFIATGHFRGHLECVVVAEVIFVRKVYDSPDSRLLQNLVEKLAAQIIIRQRVLYLLQLLYGICFLEVRVKGQESFGEPLCKDIRLGVELNSRNVKLLTPFRETYSYPI